MTSANSIDISYLQQMKSEEIFPKKCCEIREEIYLITIVCFLFLKIALAANITIKYDKYLSQ